MRLELEIDKEYDTQKTDEIKFKNNVLKNILTQIKPKKYTEDEFSEILNKLEFGNSEKIAFKLQGYNKDKYSILKSILEAVGVKIKRLRQGKRISGKMTQQNCGYIV